jgi:hypothetical protein
MGESLTELPKIRLWALMIRPADKYVTVTASRDSLNQKPDQYHEETVSLGK